MPTSLLEYSTLLSRLREVPCPYKLYPARIRALEILTGKRLLSRIHGNITMRLAAHVGPGWKDQFQRDLDTYGLLEAIGYFHSYNFSPDSESFVREACQLYDELAALYMEHHEDLATSDDPRIQVQLALLRELGDPTEHTMPVRFPSLSAPDPIPEPEPPEADPAYERRLPIHPVALSLGIGSEEDAPGSLPAELVESFTASWMFEGFPGIHSAFFEVAKTLLDFEIDPFSPAGQWVIETLRWELDEELFGDYDRWIYCSSCGREMKVSATLESINRSLVAGGWLCKQCAEET